MYKILCVAILAVIATAFSDCGCETPKPKTKCDVCTLQAVTGPCDAYFPRFYYDQNSEKCESFIYGGCGNNGNNYLTVEECEAACKKPKIKCDVCSLQAVTGNCKAHMPRWYYDQDTEECEVFIYGGCGGNGNNFLTVEECEAACKTTPIIAVEDSAAPKKTD